MYRAESQGLPSPAQALFLRLFQRRGPWFQARTFSYSEVEDSAAAVQQLVEAGLARTDANADPQARSQIAGTALTGPPTLLWKQSCSRSVIRMFRKVMNW